MPEGDTILRTAADLSRALAGTTIGRVSGSHAEVIRNGRRLTGCSVIAVESVGKHLLVRFDNGWTLRTHLGMPGSWRIEDPGGRWSRNPGAARVVLESETVRAVCYAAPTVQIAPDSVVHSALGHLGPDASGDEFDEAEAVRRLAERPATIAVGAAITDQSAIAGVGNVFKSEILFLERIHPAMSVGDLDVEQLTRLAPQGPPAARRQPIGRSQDHNR